MRPTTRLLAVMSSLAIPLSLSAGAAHAQSDKTVINAIVTTGYPPFGYIDAASNKRVGFNYDLIGAMASKMGANVKWSEAGFDQYINSVLTKRADLVAAMIDTPKRRESISFLDYSYDNSIFFTQRSKAADFANMHALCGKQVAAERTTLWVDLVAKWSDENCIKAGKPAIVVLGTVSTPDAMLQVDQGRADAAVAGEGTVAHQNTVHDDRYVAIGQPFDRSLMGFGFSKNDPQFGQALKEALSAVMADGTYKKLLRKYNLSDATGIERPMINGQP